MKTFVRAHFALALLLWAAPAVCSAATEERIQKEFAIQPGGELVVAIDFGSIDIATSPTAGIAVDIVRRIERGGQASEKAFLADHPVVFDEASGKLTIRSGSVSKLNWGLSDRSRTEARYTIRVPDHFKVDLRTAGGGIAIRNLTGEAVAHTSGGPLRFTNIHGLLDGRTSGGPVSLAGCEGDLNVKTSGGRIDATGGAGTLDGRTSGGPVGIRDFDGPVKVSTSGGPVTLENIGGAIEGSTSGGPIVAALRAPLPGDVSLSTSGGGVTVSAPPSAAFVLNASTSGGGASCELPVVLEGKKKSDSVKGMVNGGGPSVRLRSNGGPIRVKAT